MIARDENEVLFCVSSNALDSHRMPQIIKVMPYCVITFDWGRWLIFKIKIYKGFSLVKSWIFVGNKGGEIQNIQMGTTYTKHQIYGFL